MKILINNEIKTLEIADPKTGCNWVQDLIGNAGGFDGYNYDKELYTMTKDTYDWWSNYLKAEQSLQNRASELKSSLNNDDAEKFEQDMINAGDNDLELMQLSQKEIVDTWERGKRINDIYRLQVLYPRAETAKTMDGPLNKLHGMIKRELSPPENLGLKISNIPINYSDTCAQELEFEPCTMGDLKRWVK